VIELSELIAVITVPAGRFGCVTGIPTYRLTFTPPAEPVVPGAAKFPRPVIELLLPVMVNVVLVPMLVRRWRLRVDDPLTIRLLPPTAEPGEIRSYPNTEVSDPSIRIRVVPPYRRSGPSPIPP